MKKTTLFIILLLLFSCGNKEKTEKTKTNNTIIKGIDYDFETENLQKFKIVQDKKEEKMQELLIMELEKLSKKDVVITTTSTKYLSKDKKYIGIIGFTLKEDNELLKQ